jgi:hypothetical protein
MVMRAQDHRSIADLLLPDVPEGEHALRAEDLGGAELAELAPVLAGRREDDVRPAVEHDLAAEKPGAGGEVGVVRLEDLARHLPRRDDHERGLAELEHHERAVGAGEVPERAVREHVHQVVHAADHRQLPRPRREPRLGPEQAPEDAHQDDGDGGDEEGLAQSL